MPGFLSPYEGTERIDLGRGYWVDVKKCLTAKEMGAFEAAMGGKQRLDVTAGRQYAQIDTRAGRVELVVLSLVDWNLDDDEGNIWPLGGVTDAKTGKVTYPPGCERRQSVDRLPGSVFDKVWKVVDTLNGQEDTESRVSFPDEAVGGDQDGSGGSADPGPLPDGTGDVAEAWDQPGSPA